MSTHERLERLEETLEHQGADALRLELVRRARLFKRSWVEMAEALIRVRKRATYRDWGYRDFHEYCESELHIRKATVDKLTGSYQALEEHAPNVLARDGIAQPIPTYDAVDYFARALRKEPANDEVAHESAVGELRAAVFDDMAPVAALRRRFDPVFHPKPEGAAELEALDRTRAAVRKLRSLLLDLEAPLDEKRRARLAKDLEGLEGELDEHLAEAKAARRAATGSDG